MIDGGETDDDAVIDEDDTTSAENNSSVISRLVSESRTMLFTGDAGVQAFDRAVIPAQLTSVDWLDVPHHGSKHNVNSRVLDRLMPTIAYFSAKGTRKHPSRAVIPGGVVAGGTQPAGRPTRRGVASEPRLGTALHGDFLRHHSSSSRPAYCGGFLPTFFVTRGYLPFGSGRAASTASDRIGPWSRRIRAKSIFPGRAPAGVVLLRALCGGWNRPDIVDWDDGRLLAAVRGELRQAMGVVAAPVFHQVVRWTKAIPQYHLGHLERVAWIEGRAARHPGLHLGGNAYRGVALNDCVERANVLAERVAGRLADRLT